MDAFFDKLKSYNRNNTHGTRIYVSERHLPKRMQDDRAKLLPKFLEAKKNREKPKWHVNHETARYCYKINDVIYEPPINTDE